MPPLPHVVPKSPNVRSIRAFDRGRRRADSLVGSCWSVRANGCTAAQLATLALPESTSTDIAGIVAGLAEFAVYAMARDHELAEEWLRSRGPL